ncbi:MAG: hypothetical protein HXY35_05425 [Chloroflexi bacterium]|nr:hypothetical protein [Chloroflexota bacterium]
MANQNKDVIKGKVQKLGNRKFKIEKGKDSEVDIDIDILEDGEYEVEKLSLVGLPDTMYDGNRITWFNNFAIKKNGQYINQKFKVTISGLLNILGKSRLVIFDGNGDPYYYTGSIINDTFELTDGDPATGKAP